MSYDIYLKDPNTWDTIELPEKHDVKGGTFAVGGTTEAWINVTYNYAARFEHAFSNDKGVRSIYGLTAAQSIPILEAAMSRLGDDTHPDYWEPTEGNAKEALRGLLELARLAPPDSVWKGD